MSLVDVVVSLAASAVNIGFIRILRVLRLARMLRLIKRVRGLNDLFTTLYISLPALWNVGALIFLLFFVYAYIGVQIFGHLAQSTGGAINYHASFADFGKAILTLFRASCKDDWSPVMQGMMEKPPACSYAAGTCGTLFTLPYMLSFMILVGIVMINLFPTVIIENFETTMQQEEWTLQPATLDTFVVLWARYDDGSGTILPRQFEELLVEIGPPLGLKKNASPKEIVQVRDC